MQHRRIFILSILRNMRSRILVILRTNMRIIYIELKNSCLAKKSIIFWAKVHVALLLPAIVYHIMNIVNDTETIIEL